MSCLFSRKVFPLYVDNKHILDTSYVLHFLETFSSIPLVRTFSELPTGHYSVVLTTGVKEYFVWYLHHYITTIKYMESVVLVLKNVLGMKRF